MMNILSRSFRNQAICIIYCEFCTFLLFIYFPDTGRGNADECSTAQPRRQAPAVVYRWRIRSHFHLLTLSLAFKNGHQRGVHLEDVAMSVLQVGYFKYFHF